MKALFQLETGMAVDTGTTTQGGVFWGRQALVGLSGRPGTLTLGRQYTPQFIALDNDDPFGTGAGSAISSGIVSLLAVRANNSVVYESPKLGDFSFSLLGAAGEGVGPKLYSGAGRFTHGPATVGLAFTQLDTAAKASTLSLSGGYDFGVVNVTGGVQRVKNLTGALNTEDDRSEFWGGVLVPVGGQGVVSFGYGSGKTKNVAGTHASQWSGGYTYNLSKRTSLYGIYTMLNNDTNTAFSTDTATGAGPAVSAGHDVRALQVGMRHRF
jgi:predicted porin